MPADIKDATRSADRRLRETTEEKHTLRAALDWVTIALAFAIALVVALVVHFVVSALVSVVVFLVLFGVGWYVLARVRRAPRPLDADGERDEDRADD